MTEKKYMSMRELWRMAGCSFEPSHFVSKPDYFSNSAAHIPLPIIPTHLMKAEDAQNAQLALDACESVIGSWGERRSKKNSPVFEEPAEDFKRITGVEILDVFKLAFDHLIISNLPYVY